MTPIACALWLAALAAPAADTEEILSRWLDAQTNLTTWQADFVQTRTLAALAQPLSTPGRVRFAAPNRFHWQLGEPAQTIAIREPDRLTVVYPRLKRAERYSLDAKATGPWKDALALIEAGFPRSRAELEQRFQMRPLTVSGGGRYVLAMQPRAASARKLLAEVQLVFTVEPAALVATQMKFADGSLLRNDFTNITVNAALDDALFKPVLDAGYQVTEPARR
jgi:outer membrane lipoprotein-sorting protein